MSKQWAKERTIDRETWPSGPWDDEPDFHEWITPAGYSAYAARLESGAWYAAIIAPYPKEGMTGLAFSHTLRDKRHARWYRDRKDPHLPGMVSKSDVDGLSEWTISMEHYDSPLPSKFHSWTRGAYKTLEETIEITNSVAQDIFDIYKDGTYLLYFER